MKKIRAAITAVGGYVPEHVMTNKELETIVDTSDEWIRSRTGIIERRIQREPGKATSDMCVPVVEQLLEKSGSGKDDIDLIICATITSDLKFPDTANTIADKVGLTNIFGFDISAACSGFIYALHVGAQFIEAGTYKKIIILGADKMSSIINYEDRTTCVIFGDGAGGVLLEPSEDEDGVIDTIVQSDGSGRNFLSIEAGGSLKPTTHESLDNREQFVQQEGKVVFKWAVRSMVESVKSILKRNDYTVDQIDWLVPHQANMRIIDSVANSIGFPEEKVMKNIHRYGNTTAATIPLCLYDWEDKLKKGDNVLLTAFGGGFTWGSVLLKWAYNPK